MNAESQSPDRENRADIDAAGWLIKRDRGLSAAEQDQFLQWLGANPLHREWFARHCATWRDFNLLAHWRPEHSAEPNPDLLALPRAARASLRTWIGGLAAACVALVSLLWLTWKNEPEPAAAHETVATAYEKRILDDGSVVDLNGGARLRILYTDAERRVVLLAGEAQFTVAKNRQRPFVVRAGGVEVRAVGTAFNIRLQATEVDILVTEGKVQVERPKDLSTLAATAAESATPALVTIAPEAQKLVAGQRAIVSLAAHAPRPRILAVSAEDITRLLMWQPQLLDFNSSPLRAVVAEFNRRNRVQLSVLDEELNDVPIVASFRSDNIEGFVRLLEVTGVARIENRGSGEILLRKLR